MLGNYSGHKNFPTAFSIFYQDTPHIHIPIPMEQVFLHHVKMFLFDSVSTKLLDYIFESYCWMDHGGSFFFVQLSWNIIEHDLLVKWRGHTVIVLPGADLITGMILTGINWGVEDRGLVSLFGFSLSFFCFMSKTD